MTFNGNNLMSRRDLFVLGMRWFVLLGGIGLIWGIITDNLLWGLIFGAGIGWFVDYYVEKLKSEKKQ